MKNKLITIYNLLSQISTSGEDTIRMGSCLVELGSVINAMNEETVDTDETK